MYPGINIKSDHITLINHRGDQVLKVNFQDGYVMTEGHNKNVSCMNNDEFIEFLDTLKANVKRYDFEEQSV